jgi:hypothetical protein
MKAALFGRRKPTPGAGCSQSELKAALERGRRVFFLQLGCMLIVWVVVLLVLFRYSQLQL